MVWLLKIYKYEDIIQIIEEEFIDEKNSYSNSFLVKMKKNLKNIITIKIKIENDR